MPARSCGFPRFLDAVVLGDVVNQFLQDVFHRNDAYRLAGVGHDSKMDVLSVEVFEGIVDRKILLDECRRLQNGTDVQVLVLAVFFEIGPDDENADDIVLAVLVDGNTGEVVGKDFLVDHVRRQTGDVDAVDFLHGDVDVLHLQGIEGEDIVQDLCLVLFEKLFGLFFLVFRYFLLVDGDADGLEEFLFGKERLVLDLEYLVGQGKDTLEEKDDREEQNLGDEDGIGKEDRHPVWHALGKDLRDGVRDDVDEEGHHDSRQDGLETFRKAVDVADIVEKHGGKIRHQCLDDVVSDQNGDQRVIEVVDMARDDLRGSVSLVGQGLEMVFVAIGITVFAGGEKAADEKHDGNQNPTCPHRHAPNGNRRFGGRIG